MCSSCGQSSNSNLKIRQQQNVTAYSVQAQAEYDAAMAIHLNATGQNRAVRKNRELQQNKKQYR